MHRAPPHRHGRNFRPEHWETDIIQHADWIHSALKADNPFEDSLEISLAFHLVCNTECERMVVAR